MLNVRELIYFTDKLIQFNYANGDITGDCGLQVNGPVDIVEHCAYGDDDRWNRDLQSE